jgi:hypothetical protein
VQVCPVQQVSPTLPQAVQVPVEPKPAPVHAVPDSVHVRVLVLVPQQAAPLVPQGTHWPGEASPVPQVRLPAVQRDVLPLMQHSSPGPPQAPPSETQAPAAQTPRLFPHPVPCVTQRLPPPPPVDGTQQPPVTVQADPAQQTSPSPPQAWQRLF